MAVAVTTIVAATIEIITSVPASVKPPSRRVAKEGRVKEKETSRKRERERDRSVVSTRSRGTDNDISDAITVVRRVPTVCTRYNELP